MGQYLEKLNMKLKVLKTFHRPKTREAGALELNIVERTIRNYIDDGDIVIGNAIIPFVLKKNSDGRSLSNNKKSDDDVDPYDMMLRSSVHPVVLPLNLTEVYLLTTGMLDNLGRNHPQYAAYKDIADKIYSQLSEYGKGRVNPSKHDLIDLQWVQYESESDSIGRNFWKILGTAEKFGSKVKVTLANDEYICGKIDHRNTRICIIHDNGEITPVENLGIKNIENI